MHLNPGILPDIMHLSHLAIIPDIALSLLCDITDGPHRDDKLDDLFENYRSFCESQGNRDPNNRPMVWLSFGYTGTTISELRPL